MYYLCSENTGADQMHRASDLRLLFLHMHDATPIIV